MDWKEYYKQHLMSAEDAVNHIRSGSRVAMAHVYGEPLYLLDVTMANTKACKDVEIVYMVAVGKAKHCKPEYARNFRHNAFFAGGTSQDAIVEGRGDFTPSFFFEVPHQFSSTMSVDVAMAMMTLPDENGICSLGMSVNYTLEAVKQTRLVIAQVNPQMPWTDPYSLVFVKDLDCIVEHEAPIIELKPPKISNTEKVIRERCISLMPGGVTLQLSIGTVLDAMLLFLKHRKDLGVRSEIFPDGMVELAEVGIITNVKKVLHPSKFEVAFLMSIRRLYGFVDHNPDMELCPVDYVDSSFIIAQNENMVFINSCIQVGLTGQVAFENIGPKQVSDVSGQADFVRGASANKGDVSIMAMPSTVKGKISRIVPLLDKGAAVTTSRNDVDYIITEYDVATLKDRTLHQHVRSLIGIAHPGFRDELKTGYERRFHCKYQAAWDGPEVRPIWYLHHGIERKRAMADLEKYDRLLLTAFRVKPEKLPGLKYRGILLWDSLSRMDLMGDMEEIFKISIGTAGVLDLSSYEKGREILVKYGVEP